MKGIQQCNSLIEYVRDLKASGCSEIELKKNISQFLEVKARNNLIPIHGYFELTPFCNLDCKMCYIHLGNEMLHTAHLLSVQTWKDYFEQSYKAGMRKATLTGGECLIYPGFDELFLFLLKKRVGVNVLSNGILFDDKKIDFFKKNPPDSIQVTLYGSSDEAYESVTGHAVFSRIIDNLNNIKAAGLNLQIAITPNAYMVNDIKNLISLAESLDVPYRINSKLIQPRANTGRSIEDLTNDQYLEIYKYQASLRNYSPVPVNPEDLPPQNNIGQFKTGLRCGAGRSTFAISYDGKMMACSSLDDYSISLQEYGFCKAWEMVNHYAINYPSPSECNACAYFSICLPCEALHKNAPKGHCDKSICERTRKLAEAGFYQYKKQNNEEAFQNCIEDDNNG